MITGSSPEQAPRRGLRALAVAAATVLLVTAAYLSGNAVGASKQLLDPVPALRNENTGGPPYFLCDSQKLKAAKISCDTTAGAYVHEMSKHGCDLFWTSACFECCGVPAPFPPSPPPPSPPLLGNKWANAGLNTGLTFAKKGVNTGWTFASANPLDTDYKKLGTDTGKEYSDQYFKEAHGYVNLDETGTLKAAADPGLEIFENAVTEGHKLAAGPVQPAAAADN
mmetsp:Transcript_33041/g.106867  ORF Transcript_33041/g.106867 Transcript_33041/m.106867 type:complete len:224 (-) Transcript_33041:541-1212(-)